MAEPGDTTASGARLTTGNLRGMSFMLAATFVLICQHTVAKHLSGSMPPFEIVFFRTIFGLLALLPWFVRQGFGMFRTSKLGLHFVRAFFQTISALSFFYALGVAPLAQVTALHFTAPIFATILAIFLLGERLSWRRWSAIIIGFAGTYVILKPGGDGFDPALLIVLVAALSWAATMIVIKVLGRTESSVTTTAYMYLLMCPLTFFVCLPTWVWPTLEQYGLLVVVGITGSYAHILMAQSLKEGDANVVTPVEFFKLVWASLFGYLLFAELPNPEVYIGGFMIFSSGTYIAYRESKLRRAREKMARAAASDPPDA